MEILRKIATNKNNPATTIVFLGDSVTQGCFRTHCDFEAVYHNVLKRKLEMLCPKSVINVINAGIAGTAADYGAQRRSVVLDFVIIFKYQIAYKHKLIPLLF